jgi:hypothetical protein
MEPCKIRHEEGDFILLWIYLYKQRQRAPGSLGTSLNLTCYSPLDDVQRFGEVLEGEIKQAMSITDPEDIEHRF